MNKKGFTLTELLVVIAIIGVLSVIIIPNVVKVNENINERLYNQRVEYIIEGAENYANANPDIFNGGDTAEVYVWELVLGNYLDADSSDSEICSTKTGGGTVEGTLSVGCVSNPKDQTSMNDQKIILTKKAVGVVAELDGNPGDETVSDGSAFLVDKVCEGWDKGQFLGKSATGDSYCKCTGRLATNNLKIESYNFSNGEYGTSKGSAVSSCIIVSKNDNGDVNNWLKYGASTANWRVLGLYSIPKEGGGGNEIVAKMITSTIVD